MKSAIYSHFNPNMLDMKKFPLTTYKYIFWPRLKSIQLMTSLCLLPLGLNAVWSSAIGLYEFNGNLNDSNGNNHGAAFERASSGAPDPVVAQFQSFLHQDLPAWSGNAMVMDGGPFVYLGQGSENAFQITGSLTLFTRINISEVDANMQLMSKDGAAGQRSFGLRLSESEGLVFRINGGKTISYASPSVLQQTGVWLDLAVVFSAGESMKMFINGELVVQDTSGIPASITNSSTTPFFLGASPFPVDNPGAGPFNGFMERAAIWDYALTDAQIYALSVVPEPGQTVALMISLIGALVLLQHRKKAK